MGSNYPQSVRPTKPWQMTVKDTAEVDGDRVPQVTRAHNGSHHLVNRRHFNQQNNKQRKSIDAGSCVKCTSPPVRSPEQYRAAFLAHINDSRILDDRSDDERSSTASTSSRYLQLETALHQPGQKRRKFSHPVSLQQHHLQQQQQQQQQRYPRRFSSAVSDAVTRKLSTTIGWARPSPVAIGDLVAQGKSLCGQYIRWRLKRCGMLPRKCAGLQRLRSCASLPVVREVLPELIRLGQELERMHPKVYCGVARQACPTPGGMVTSEKVLTFTLTRVAQEIMRQGVTWPKIASLYAVAGGLAVDCVAQGHPQFLQAITEAMAIALHQGVAPWIFLKGGWGGLHNYCKPPSGGVSVGSFLGLLAAAILSLILLALLIRWLARTTPWHPPST